MAQVTWKQSRKEIYKSPSSSGQSMGWHIISCEDIHSFSFWLPVSSKSAELDATVHNSHKVKLCLHN